MRCTLTTVILAGMALTAIATAQQTTAQQVALQAAIRTETVSGDLKRAIAEYQTIVDKYAKADRAVAAEALVRMADCYQKQGNAQATKLFERVLREYADQKGAAQIATARLGRSATAASATGMTTRQLWTGKDVDDFGTVSPDGRYLSFVDWKTGNLAIRELSNGAVRHLTKDGNNSSDPSRFAEESAFSRDGSQIAYSWFDDKKGHYELRVLRTDVSSGSTPRVLFDNPDVTWIAPYDWSPDGKRLGVQLKRRDRTAQIGILSTADGAYHSLRTVDWSASTRLFFSPDGSMIAYDLPVNDGSGERDVFVVNADGSKESVVAAHPGHDSAAGWSPDGQSVLIASDRAGSTGLWLVPLSAIKSGAAPTLLKADIGHMTASLGVTRAGALLYSVRTHAVSIGTAFIDFEQDRLTVPPVQPFENYLTVLRGPDWSADGLLVAIHEISRSALSLTIRTVEGKKVRDLPLAMSYAGRPRWAPDGSITVQGLDLKGRQGIYRVDPQSAEVAPIVIGEAGRPVVQCSWLPDGKSILYRRGVSANNSVTVVRTLASGEERVLLDVSNVNAVSPDGRWLAYAIRDNTIQSAGNTLRLMPLNGATSTELVRFPASATIMGEPLWTPDSATVVFLQQQGEQRSLWAVSAKGGTARNIASHFDGAPPLRLHPDGHRIAYNTGANAVEIWTLENFLPQPAAAAARR